VRETLMLPRMSSKWVRWGSEGRMRMSWVILQRRLERRSAFARLAATEFWGGLSICT
jgi:hypothetical protein